VTTRYHARDIARALMLVASGVSYRRAARTTRTEARRNSSGVTWGRRQFRKRQRVLDGQLVANWVEFAHGRSLWPDRMAVDSVGFRAGGAVPRAFHIMVAVGYEAPGYNAPRVWLMRPFPRKDQAAWEDSGATCTSATPWTTSCRR